MYCNIDDHIFVVVYEPHEFLDFLLAVQPRVALDVASVHFVGVPGCDWGIGRFPREERQG